MGALRKAGVWLGLVEDEDDLEYDDAPGESYSRYRGGRSTQEPRRTPTRTRDQYEEDFDDEEDDIELTRVTRKRLDRADRSTRLGADPEREPSRLGGVEARLEQARAERSATVRPITRPAAAPAQHHPVSTRESAPLTRDNLALAPTERQAPAVDDDRRTQITTLHPTRYNEARQIGERFRDGNPVIMNLTEMDEADAKRLVDFAAGLVFGLRGNFERVTNRVFLLSPANVQVTAEDKAKIAEGGFFHHS